VLNAKVMNAPWRERIAVIDAPAATVNGTVNLELQSIVNDTSLESECFIVRVTDKAIDCFMYRLSGQLTAFIGGQASTGDTSFANPAECPIPLESDGSCSVSALQFSYSDVRDEPTIGSLKIATDLDDPIPTSGGTRMLITGSNFGVQIGDVEMRWYRPD